MNSLNWLLPSSSHTDSCGQARRGKGMSASPFPRLKDHDDHLRPRQKQNEPTINR